MKTKVFKDFREEHRTNGLYAIFDDGTVIRMYTKYMAITKAWKEYTLKKMKEIEEKEFYD